MEKFKNIFHKSVIAVAILSLSAIIAYTATQQTIRLSVNDEPSRLAEDTAALLNKENNPNVFKAPVASDMETSLAPYIIVVDPNGKLLLSNSILRGETPVPPQGVFNAAELTGEEQRTTWQPAKGVRHAIAVVSYNGGFVVGGRSLRLAEENIDATGGAIFRAWLFSVLTLWFVFYLKEYGLPEQVKKHPRTLKHKAVAYYKGRFNKPSEIV